MNGRNHKLLMVGLPGTGKTTFLAAFWHFVGNNDSNALRLKELPASSDYLDKISTDWVSCRSPERTKIGVRQIVEMRLEDLENNLTIEVTVPDLSGEMYSSLVKDRQASQDYAKDSVDASGILLFVHPEKVNEPTLISEAEPLIREIQDGDDTVKNEEIITPWNIEKMPTAVQLVELLQFHIEYGLSSLIKRIAVVISAWDLVQNETESPAAWLKKHLPLLNQFLLSNKDRINSKIYGISAQGADYTVKQDKSRLLGLIEPLERIIVVNEENKSYDIGGPIRWLTTGQNKL